MELNKMNEDTANSSPATNKGHSRFLVSQVGYDNPVPVTDDTPGTRRNSRLMVPEFLSSFLPGRSRSTSLIPENDVSVRSSRNNSIFAEFFKESDKTVMDYTQEAAPRLESYRNSLTMHKYMVRPSLDELHEAQQADSQPSLAPGKGLDTGAIKFGWIKGVYIRCLLNIWGVMLFLRMGWMTGQCGIILAVVIVLLSTVVTVITTLSMSAICTNGDVRGGGAYYLISRSLGPEFGGVVGIILFLANAISGAMYILGAGEAIRDILRENNVGIVEFPSDVNDIRLTSVICLLLMMSVTGFGMAFENKTQMILLVILLVALSDYYVGGCLKPTLQQKAQGFTGWDLGVALANTGPDFRGETFFSVFAVFFPSVTGILAGANISGDLKDPCMAIPKGTLLAILTTSVSYVLVIVWLGFTVLRDATGNVGDVLNGTFGNCTGVSCDFGLQNNNQVMYMSSAFGPLIYAGIFAACLSSALVSIVSAPRILQALCVDGILPWLNWLGKGYGPDNDPRRGLVLTFFIALIFTVIGDLNAVAPIISNFFMAANGLINFSCFHASYVKIPGFRPGFKYYNLWLSLVGALLCVVIMFVMSWIMALVTDVIVIALYIYIAKTCPDINWGSSFQGYAYRNALYYLNKLYRVEEHVKTYRPAVLVLTGNASSRPQLVDFGGLLTKNHGLQICGNVSKEPHSWNMHRLSIDLNTKWLIERRTKAFYSLVDSDSLASGVSNLFQVSGIGKMRPNILLMGFKQNWETCDSKNTLDYFHTIHETLDAHLSLAILRLGGGTDYSKYFESTEGFPVLHEYLKKRNKQTRMSPITDIVISLETVEEESSTPSSMTTPPVTPSMNQEVYSTLQLAAEKCEELEAEEKTSEAVATEENCKEPCEEEEAELPPNIDKMVNMFREKQEKGTIDVWWLYDDGGLTLLLPYIMTTRSRFKDCKLRVFSVAQDDTVISDEQLNLAALLKKFRIPFSDLSVLSSVGESIHERSAQRFEKIMSKWIVKDESNKDPTVITRNTLKSHKKKTNQYLRIRELLEKHSRTSNMIVMTLPLPRKQGCPAPLFMAWLDILTYDMPPFLLVRGNQTSVLTFYS